ncbi:MAG: hypothetical protein ACJAZS_000586 [Alteromonas naphthalenivorans]|jgi:hypothetical protein
MIYLWDLPDLIKDLRTDTVPLWKIRIYYTLSPIMSITNGLLFSVLLFGHHIVEHTFKCWIRKPHASIQFYNYWGTSLGFLTVFIAFFGMYLCYRENKKGDNKNFWARMACLSFPVNFNITMYSIALLGSVSFISYFFFQAKIVAFQEQMMCAPVLATPFIPGKIHKFATKMRTMILMAYPVLAFLPAVLSFIHYAILRSLIKDVAQNQDLQAPTNTIDYDKFDQFD